MAAPARFPVVVSPVPALAATLTLVDASADTFMVLVTHRILQTGIQVVTGAGMAFCFRIAEGSAAILRDEVVYATIMFRYHRVSSSPTQTTFHTSQVLFCAAIGEEVVCIRAIKGYEEVMIDKELVIVDSVTRVRMQPTQNYQEEWRQLVTCAKKSMDFNMEDKHFLVLLNDDSLVTTMQQRYQEITPFNINFDEVPSDAGDGADLEVAGVEPGSGGVDTSDPSLDGASAMDKGGEPLAHEVVLDITGDTASAATGSKMTLTVPKAQVVRVAEGSRPGKDRVSTKRRTLSAEFEEQIQKMLSFGKKYSANANPPSDLRDRKKSSGDANTREDQVSWTVFPDWTQLHRVAQMSRVQLSVEDLEFDTPFLHNCVINNNSVRTYCHVDGTLPPFDVNALCRRLDNLGNKHGIGKLEIDSTKRYGTKMRMGIKLDELLRLPDREDLHENSINMYMTLCMIWAHLEPDLGPSFFILSTDVMMTVLQGTSYGISAIKGWFEGCDFQNVDMVIIPVNSDNSHWATAVADLRNNLIAYIDSWSSNDANAWKVCTIIADLVSVAAKAAGSNRVGTEWFICICNQSTRRTQALRIIMQQNNDCGYYPMMFVDLITRGESLTCLTQRDVDVLRSCLPAYFFSCRMQRVVSARIKDGSRAPRSRAVPVDEEISEESGMTAFDGMFGVADRTRPAPNSLSSAGFRKRASAEQVEASELWEELGAAARSDVRRNTRAQQQIHVDAQRTRTGVRVPSNVPLFSRDMAASMLDLGSNVFGHDRGDEDDDRPRRNLFAETF